MKRYKVICDWTNGHGSYGRTTKWIEAMSVEHAKLICWQFGCCPISVEEVKQP